MLISKDFGAAYVFQAFGRVNPAGDTVGLLADIASPQGLVYDNVPTVSLINHQLREERSYEFAHMVDFPLDALWEITFAAKVSLLRLLGFFTQADLFSVLCNVWKQKGWLQLASS